MADEKRNALAELAFRIDAAHTEMIASQVPKQYCEYVKKAQRIVAELAKVREWFIETVNKQGNDGKVGCHYFKTRCYIAFKECRAIAEEGTK